MNLALAYIGDSGLKTVAGYRILQFAPNLTREPVAFDAMLRHPVRFREAVSALHDVVTADLKFKPKDRSAWRAWKESEQRRLQEFRNREYQRLKAEQQLAPATQPTPELERAYQRCLKRYRKARSDYNRYLQLHDPRLWRLIMPLDPVITVAEDMVFYEGFSADESAYGCLMVNRDAFDAAAAVRLGTTNVDYSPNLYQHFQKLRSYRETRFRIDPEGFNIKTEGREDYREEKIDLPPGWLRGFIQLQSAMTMPLKKIALSPATVYSLLAWLRRHRDPGSPRALRFELVPNQPVKMVLEPWEKPIICHDARYPGTQPEIVRIWGRRRLMTLARLLPLAEDIQVYLLGTGLPSFWSLSLGEMSFVLGLSGWTANDWTHGTSLDLLAPPAEPAEGWIAAARRLLQKERKATFATVRSHLTGTDALTAAALNHLARAGQVIYDLRHEVYRWRQIMPFAVGQAETGELNPELQAAQLLLTQNRLIVKSVENIEGFGKLALGEAEKHPLELLLNGDGRIQRGKCGCGHHRKFGLRNGPCRHLLALRLKALGLSDETETDLDSWRKRRRQWALD